MRGFIEAINPREESTLWSTKLNMRNPEKVARLLMDYDLVDEAYTY